MFQTLLYLWLLLIILSIIFRLFMRPKKYKNPFAPYRVQSIITCPNCNFKGIRDFKVGDYVFKDEPCACGGKRLISAIFREMEESGTSR